MNSLSIVALMVTLSLPLTATAQPPPTSPIAIDPANGLSLEAAIARAIEQEPGLRSARTAIDVAAGLRIQAGLRPNPSVSFEQRSEPGGSDAVTAIGAQWPLDLFRRAARIAVAEREVTAAGWTIADRRRLLAADVRARYGDVLASVRDLSVLDEIIAATRRQLDLLVARVDQGASPPLERDLVSVEVQRLASRRLMLLGRSEAALIGLRRVLGMAPDSPLTLRDTLEAIVEGESAASPDGAPPTADSRADVREAAARIGVAEAKVGRAESQGRFDVGVFANYMRMDAGFPQQGFDPNGALTRVRGVFHYFSAGASVTLPLRNRNQGEIAAARAEHAGAVAAHEAARLSALAEAAAARALDQRARDGVRVFAGGARALARQNLMVVGQSYELGRVTVFDVLDEQRRLLDLESAYSDALRAAFEARTALNRALGVQP